MLAYYVDFPDQMAKNIEGWWLSGCLVVIELSGRALAAQGRCPGFDSQRLPSFSLSSIFFLITSKFSLFQHEARVVSRGKSLEHAFLKKKFRDGKLGHYNLTLSWYVCNL